MKDFEARVEPLQDWLKATEVTVQESTARLQDVPSKRQELRKLQVNYTHYTHTLHTHYTHTEQANSPARPLGGFSPEIQRCQTVPGKQKTEQT